MDPLFTAKITELRKYYYDDDSSLKWLEQQEKKIRGLIAKEGLSANASVVAIIDDALHRITVISQMLSTDETLTAEQRSRLFTERNVHKFWLNRFDAKNIETHFESISNALDEELKRIRE